MVTSQVFSSLCAFNVANNTIIHPGRAEESWVNYGIGHEVRHVILLMPFLLQQVFW